MFAGAIASVPATADTILFSNVSSAVPFGSGGLQGDSISYVDAAFAFTPTTSGNFADALVNIWTLTSFGPDSSVTASLYSNSLGDTPGTLLAQLDTATAPSYSSFPFLPFSSNDTSFTQISGPAVSLAAGTEYWLVLAPGDANSIALYAYGNGATVDVPEVQQDFSTGPWVNPSQSNVELEIDGTPASVTPEPSSFLLLGSGLVGLAGMIARKLMA